MSHIVGTAPRHLRAPELLLGFSQPLRGLQQPLPQPAELLLVRLGHLQALRALLPRPLLHLLPSEEPHVTSI